MKNQRSDEEIDALRKMIEQLQRELVSSIVFAIKCKKITAEILTTICLILLEKSYVTILILKTSCCKMLNISENSIQSNI